MASPELPDWRHARADAVLGLVAAGARFIATMMLRSTQRPDVERLPWRPGRVLDSIARAVELV